MIFPYSMGEVPLRLAIIRGLVGEILTIIETTTISNITTTMATNAI